MYTYNGIILSMTGIYVLYMSFFLSESVAGRNEYLGLAAVIAANTL